MVVAPLGRKTLLRTFKPPAYAGSENVLSPGVSLNVTTEVHLCGDEMPKRGFSPLGPGINVLYKETWISRVTFTAAGDGFPASPAVSAVTREP